MIIALCSLLIPVLALPLWRASLITTIAMLVVILLVNTNANAQLEAYKARLL